MFKTCEFNGSKTLLILSWLIIFFGKQALCKNQNQFRKNAYKQYATGVRSGFGSELAEKLFERDVAVGKLPHIQEFNNLISSTNSNDPKFVSIIFNFIDQRLIFNDDRLKQLLVLGLRALVLKHQQCFTNVRDGTLFLKMFMMLYTNPALIMPSQYQYINDQAARLFSLLCAKITIVDESKLSPYEVFNQRLQANIVQGIYETLRHGKYATYGQIPIDTFQVILKNILTNIFVTPGLKPLRSMLVEKNGFFEGLLFSAEELKDFDRFYGPILRPVRERMLIGRASTLENNQNWIKYTL